MLFGAAAAVVVWHASRVTVLWDITYTLEIAHRITLGELPYRDFVVPQAPVTFAIHGAILALSGGGVWPHLAYCAVVAGLTAVLTHRLVRAQLDDLDSRLAAFIAVALAAPVTFLNGYAILPLPFYDPDAAFFVLLALAAVLGARASDFRAWRHLLAGALLVIPVFVKQNIGVAAFLPIHGILLLSALANPSERRGYRWLVGGSLAALAAALLLLQATAGLEAYYRWTVAYAASRRWPSARLVLALYAQPRTWVVALAAVAGFAIVSRARSRLGVAAGLVVAALPWVDATRTMIRWGFSARAYALWGLASVTALLSALSAIRGREWRFERALPLVAVAVAHGAFASQGVHDSSYGVWPFLAVALAWPAARLLEAAGAHQRFAAWLVAVAALVLTVLGALHVSRNERLGFANLSGPIERAAHPRLRGLAAPGSHLPDFERLLARVEGLIPAGEPVLLMPGEDPFFFASGRRPRLPVVLFDDTAAPYDREALRRLLDEHGVSWVIVKTELQLLHPPWRHLEAFLTADLPARFTLVEELPRYTIWRRR